MSYCQRCYAIRREKGPGLRRIIASLCKTENSADRHPPLGGVQTIIALTIRLLFWTTSWL